jgi:uncharacterized membrane protein YfcA
MLYFWLPLIGFAAASFSTVAGFGAGIILITFATLVMDVKEVIPISTLFFFGLSSTQLLLFRKSVDWPTVKLFCLGSLPGVLLGMALFDLLPGYAVKRVIALVVIGYCANALLKLIPERRPTVGQTVAISAVTGVVDAVTASGGTLQAPLFLARGLRKEMFVASFATTSVLLNPLKVGIYWAMGYFKPGNLDLVALLTLAGFAGVLVGRLLLQRISGAAFKTLAVGFLMVLGLKLLIWG